MIINFTIKPSATAKTADSPMIIVVHGAAGGDVTGTINVSRHIGAVKYKDQMKSPALTFSSDGTQTITGNVQSGN